MRQQWLVFLPMTLATAGLAACASAIGGDEIKVRPVDNMQTLTLAPRDTLYESAVTAINERDYGRALDYLQAAKAKDPHNVKALNALGVIYDKLGRFDLSARYYAQARAVEPESKIVAENMGYSRILQRIMDPNSPVAVANIELPPGLMASLAPAPAIAAAPQDEKARLFASAAPVAMVAAAPQAAEAPSGAFVVPVPQAAAPTPIITPFAVQANVKPLSVSAFSLLAGLTSPVIASQDLVADVPPPATVMPVVLPEQRKVSAPSLFAATSAAVPAVLPAILANSEIADLAPPVTMMPVTLPVERKVAAPALKAAPSVAMAPAFPSIVLNAEVADLAPPSTVMPVVLPVERKVVAAPSQFSAAPVTMSPVLPSVALSMPAAAPEPRPVLASVTSPTISSPTRPVERKVVALPPIMPRVTASAVLPVLRPEIMPAMVPVMPAPDTKIMIAKAMPAVPALAPPPAAPPELAAIEHAMPKQPSVRAASAASVAPAKKPEAGSARVVPVIAPAVVRAAPAKMPEKKIETASAHPAAKTVAVKPVTLASAAVPPKPVSPIPGSVAVSRVTPVTKIAEAIAASVKAVPAMIAPVQPAAAKPVPANVTAVKPVWKASLVDRSGVPNKRILTIGQPVRLFNASGKANGTVPVLRRLTKLGWSMKPSETRAQSSTVLYYPVQNLNAAKALQRTLPFPVRLTVDKANASGMRLVIGRDFLFWKPRSARLAALWQKSPIVASLQKPSIRGVR